MKTGCHAVLVLVLLTQWPNPQLAYGAETKRASLRELMTPAQFAQAGISKLTPAELGALEEWLAAYTQAVAQVVRTQEPKAAPASLSSAPSTTGTPQVIETCIQGEFTGWEGETIFKLCNGQIWQQSEYAYEYQYAYRPDVVIYPTHGGWRMKVEDVEDTIGVTRIK